jgi:hypothetical protein
MVGDQVCAFVFVVLVMLVVPMRVRLHPEPRLVANAIQAHTVNSAYT